MVRTERKIAAFAGWMNWISAGALIIMMLLTTADVVLRLFRHPIPGTFEIVGLLGAVVVSFSLGYTSIEKGHIAVEFLVRRFSTRVQTTVNAVHELVSLMFFLVLTWRSVIYGTELVKSGEVSSTLQMPTYPFVYGIAFGCGLLCIILGIEFLKSIRGVEK